MSESNDIKSSEYLKTMFDSNGLYKYNKSGMSDPNLVVNNAGAKHVYEIDDMQRALRFLILGTEGGTYYKNELKLSMENAQTLLKLAKSNKWRDLIDLIVDVSVNGRAAKQQTTMFALALVARYGNTEARQYAYSRILKVCRIPTHLFMFVGYMESCCDNGTGWGKIARREISNWYNSKDASQLAYQVTKYANREGWTHTDLLRLAHVKPLKSEHQNLYKYITKHEIPNDDINTEFLSTVEIVKKENIPEDDICKFIDKYNLSREHLHTSYLNSTKVWATLLKSMGATAVMRNLGKMSSIKLFENSPESLERVLKLVNDIESLKKQRVHPFSILVAYNQYKSGKGARGNLTWVPNDNIVESLNNAFYNSFNNVKPTGKRIMICMDVSGSMDWSSINGVPGMTPCVASSAMASIALRTEENVKTMAFSNHFMPWEVDKSMSLEQIMNYSKSMNFGRTDCAQPMIYALENKIPIDTFIVYTDCETWFGDVTPAQALKNYRGRMNIPDAKLIVVAMTSTNFTIADTNDPNMLDVVGFDTSAPEIMRQFMAGEI